jgi:hypothetical protein
MSNYDNRSGFREREDASKTQLFIAKGRNDGMDQDSLIDFISEKCGIDRAKISLVKILEAFSFFAVPNEDADGVLTYFQQAAGEGRPLVSKARRKTDNKFSGGRRDFNNREGGFRREGAPRRDFNDRNNRFNNRNDSEE